MKDYADEDRREISFTLEQWACVPESCRLWYNPDPPEEVEERQQTAHEMGLVAQSFLLSSLTTRQRQVVELYCLEGRNQIKVAAALGVSQATVSQHLMGKLRGGRHVGGAFPKIRKAIHKAARAHKGKDSRYAQILAVFNELLDTSITRRRVNELVGTLARNRCRGGLS